MTKPELTDMSSRSHQRSQQLNLVRAWYMCSKVMKQQSVLEFQLHPEVIHTQMFCVMIAQ